MMLSANPAVKVIVIRLLPDEFYRDPARRADAVSFVPKHRLLDDLLAELRFACGLLIRAPLCKPEPAAKAREFRKQGARTITPSRHDGG
jgi:hypothetical protein